MRKWIRGLVDSVIMTAATCAIAYFVTHTVISWEREAMLYSTPQFYPHAVREYEV